MNCPFCEQELRMIAPSLSYGDMWKCDNVECRFWMRKRDNKFPYFRFIYNDFTVRNDYDPEHNESSFYCARILEWNSATGAPSKFETVFECPGLNISPYDTDVLIQKLRLCLTFC